MKKTLLLMCGAGLLTLASCGGPGGTSSLNSVSGTVVERDLSSQTSLLTKAWTGGAGVVNGKIGSTTTKLGDLKTDGTFTATLPTPAASDLETGNDYADPGSANGCTGKANVSDPNAKVAGLSVTVDAAGTAHDGEIAPITSKVTDGRNTSGVGTVSGSGKMGLLIYADHSVSISGNFTCPMSSAGGNFSGTVKYDLNLVKGWNAITVGQESTISYSANTPTSITSNVTISTSGLPSDKWVFGSGDGVPQGSLQELQNAGALLR